MIAFFRAVFITSPSNVYIDTSVKSPYYSQNDAKVIKAEVPKTQDVEENLKIIELLEQKCWLSIRTVLRDGDVEIQDLIAFIGNYCGSQLSYANTTN